MSVLVSRDGYPPLTHRGLAAELPVVLAAVPEVSAGLVTVARLAQGLLDHTPARPGDDKMSQCHHMSDNFPDL